MPRINHFRRVDGVASLLPVDDNGRYLDWRGVVNNEAPALSGPYGPAHFGVGSGLFLCLLDFAILPGNLVAFTAEANADMLHSEDYYFVRPADEAMQSAFTLTERIMDALARLGCEHDQDFHGADPWYFFRALGRALDIKPYMSMNEFQLRGGF
jgi:hypothetical protein